jgi:hypothetical protein
MSTELRALLRDAAARPSVRFDAETAVARGRALRRRRRLVTATVVVLLALGGTAGWSVSRSAPPRDIRATDHPAARAAGFTVTIPPGWRRAVRVLTPGLSDPREILAAGTFPLPVSARYDPACDNQLPAAVVRAMGPTDAFVWVLERATSSPTAPPRPARLGDGTVLKPVADCPGVAEHGARMLWGSFQDQGREFYAAVVLGRDAPAGRVAEAGALLDSLHFEPLRAPAVDATLAWVAPSGLVVADPYRGDATPGASSVGDWCSTCPLIGVGDYAYTAQNGRIYRLDPGGTRLRAVGTGADLFKATTPGLFYVRVGDRLERWRATRGRVAGPWRIPAGYRLTEPPVAVADGVLVVSDRDSIELTLARWDTGSGRVTRLGTVWHPVDSFRARGARTSTVAWVDCPASGAPPCALVIGDSVGGARRRIAAPEPGTGFLYGGAFSPDGTRLAAFVSATRGGGTATLVIVDLATGRVRPVAGSTVEIGEAYGYAAWSPSGRWLVFGGIDATMRAYELGTARAVPLPYAGAYSVAALAPR